MESLSVLVVGGTRFIGLHTVRSLLAAGCDVTLFHRGETEPDGLPPIRHLHGDRRDILDRRDDFERLSPDVVVDMVPLTRAHAVDAMMALTGITKRFVAISSQDVYLAYDILRGREPGPPVPIPLAEDAPLRRQRYPYRDLVEEDSPLYDYDKIPVERTYLADPDTPGTILRLPAVYGPGDYQHRPYPYLRRMVDGRRAILIDERAADWQWSRCYVENVASAITAAVLDERAAGRIYNVAERVPRTEPEWITALGDEFGWDGEIVPLPRESLPEHLRDDLNLDQCLVADSTRIRTELGYTEPVPFAEAIRRTVEWELAQMPAELVPHRFDYDAEDHALPDLTLDF